MCVGGGCGVGVCVTTVHIFCFSMFGGGGALNSRVNEIMPLYTKNTGVISTNFLFHFSNIYYFTSSREAKATSAPAWTRACLIITLCIKKQ